MSARLGPSTEDRPAVLLDDAGAPLLAGLIAFIVLVALLLTAVLL